MYFLLTKRMLEVCFSAHPNIQYIEPYFCTFSNSLQRFYRFYLPEFNSIFKIKHTTE